MGNPVVQHNFREANKVADYLSRIGASLNQPGNIISLQSPLFDVAAHLANDIKDVFCTRSVSWSRGGRSVSSV